MGDYVGGGSHEASIVSAQKTHNLFLGGGDPVDKEPGDITFSIQEMVLRIPEEPMLINGKPYAINFDTDRLAQAVNFVRKNGRGYDPGTYDPRILEVEFTPGLHPKARNSQEDPNPPVYDFKTNSLTLKMPEEVSDSKLPDSYIRKNVAESFNSDLTQGLLEAESHRLRIRGSKLIDWSGVVVLAAIGNAIEADQSTGTSELVYRGGLGALAGAALGLGIWATKNVIDVHIRKRPQIRDERVAKKAHKSANKQLDQGLLEYQSALDFSENPIITLVPAEEADILN